jgi:hypothetical protein
VGTLRRRQNAEISTSYIVQVGRETRGLAITAKLHVHLARFLIKSQQTGETRLPSLKMTVMKSGASRDQYRGHGGLPPEFGHEMKPVYSVFVYVYIEASWKGGTRINSYHFPLPPLWRFTVPAPPPPSAGLDELTPESPVDKRPSTGKYRR